MVVLAVEVLLVDMLKDSEVRVFGVASVIL